MLNIPSHHPPPLPPPAPFLPSLFLVSSSGPGPAPNAASESHINLESDHAANYSPTLFLIVSPFGGRDRFHRR